MANDLGVIIAAIASAVAHARRTADEQTALIAEHYLEHPLLRGMSAPRMRIPEVVIDIPVLVESVDTSTDGQATSRAQMIERLVGQLKAEFEAENESLPRGALSAFRDALREALPSEPSPEAARTTYVRAVGTALDTLREDPRLRSGLARVRNIDRSLQATASRHALKVEPRAAGIQVNVVTPTIQESDPDAIARLHLRMHEEGVEWAMDQREDGSESARLIPE